MNFRECGSSVMSVHIHFLLLLLSNLFRKRDGHKLPNLPIAPFHSFCQTGVWRFPAHSKVVLVVSLSCLLRVLPLSGCPPEEVGLESICEGKKKSAPSSEKDITVEESGCVEGMLIEIEQEEVLQYKPAEICLADKGGEELDLILWDCLLYTSPSPRD